MELPACVFVKSNCTQLFTFLLCMGKRQWTSVICYVRCMVLTAWINRLFGMGFVCLRWENCWWMMRKETANLATASLKKKQLASKIYSLKMLATLQTSYACICLQTVAIRVFSAFFMTDKGSVNCLCISYCGCLWRSIKSKELEQLTNF